MNAKLFKITVGVALCNIVAMPSNKPHMAMAEGEDETSSLMADGSEEASSIEEAVSSFSNGEENSEESSEASSEAGGETTDEEKKDNEAWKAIEDYIAELEKQIKQLSDTKFLNGTIGGLVSSAFTLLAYAIIKIAEKKGWKSRTELFSRANGLLDNVQTKVDELHATEKISEEQYKTATKAVSDATTLLNATNDKLNETDTKVEGMKAEVMAKYDETMKTLEADYSELMAKYSKLIEMIKEMAKGDPDLVKSGAYSKIVEIDAKADDASEVK